MTDGEDRTHDGSGRRWLAVAAVTLVLLASVDLSLPSDANISGALVVAPFFASVGATARRVACLAVVTAVTAAGLAVADSSGLHASLARLIVVIVGGMVATQAARLRIRRERRLRDITSVADAAQRAIIREPASRVGSVEIASWYQSSVDAALAGGDCYEALETPFGTRLLVGDVRGHGLPSIRLAALVIGGFRTLAYLEPDLRTVARELDRLTARYAGSGDDTTDGEEFVTAVMAQVDGRVVTIANCGHPPPLIIDPDATVGELPATDPTPPLGIGSDPTLDVRHVPPTTRLLLYTDGAIEARTADGRFFDLHAAAAALATGPLRRGVADIMEGLNAHSPQRIADDVALLAFEPCR